MMDFLNSAFNSMLNSSGNLFSGQEWLPLIHSDITPHLSDDDVVDIFMPVVFEYGGSAVSAAGQEKVKPTGELLVGALVTAQDRAILAWSKGMIRLRTFSEVIPYATVRSVAPFTMSTKMEQLPAFEVFTDDGTRWPFTFSNNLKYKGVDIVRWRDRMVRRFEGWQPEFDGAAVVRWTAPSP